MIEAYHILTLVEILYIVYTYLMKINLCRKAKQFKYKSFTSNSRFSSLHSQMSPVSMRPPPSLVSKTSRNSPSASISLSGTQPSPFGSASSYCFYRPYAPSDPARLRRSSSARPSGLCPWVDYCVICIKLTNSESIRWEWSFKKAKVFSALLKYLRLQRLCKI